MKARLIKRFEDEIAQLERELTQQLPKEIQRAREHGDLRENAEYEACKHRQGFLNARIGQIQQRIRDLSLYTLSSIPRAAVGYGSQVTLENVDGGPEEKYEIVFPEEVDPAAGLISIGSPLGRALLNREVGDEVVVATPKGRRNFQIVELRTIHDREELKPA